MNNEEKILAILGIMQTDISGLKSDVSTLKIDVAGLKSDVYTLKTDVSGLKSDVSALKTDVSSLKSDMTCLQKGQVRIESKIDKLAVLQNDDIVTLAKNTCQIRQDVKVIHTDVLYLVEKTVDNSKQILKLVK